jgi:hypothetical protein
VQCSWATPKVVKQARRALHPVDNIVYGAERQVITSLRSGSKRQRNRAPVYRHGNCAVAHRSPEAAEVPQPLASTITDGRAAKTRGQGTHQWRQEDAQRGVRSITGCRTNWSSAQPDWRAAMVAAVQVGRVHGAAVDALHPNGRRR